MTQEKSQPILTAVFVDYDNIYLSLKKKSEDAARRFSKDATSWIKEIEAGRLITATNGPTLDRPRRIVLNRCYGNPVPRRNAHDNSTDMSSFPFVRHHFLKAGFEVIDCPPLTAQLKNSSDIKMVLDVHDFLNHDTRFDEFIILSGDADFTPVLHRLRAHDRRTVIFANDFTAAPYTAICDGEVREQQLLAALIESKIEARIEAPAEAKIAAEPAAPAITSDAKSASTVDRVRAEIIATVVTAVRSAGGPVPLEALAERTTRALGHDRTVGSSWAGTGSFLELLRRELPADISLTDQPPYLAYDASRAIARQLPLPAPAVPQDNRERLAQQAAPPPQLRAMAQSPAMQAPAPLSIGAPIDEPIQPLIQQQRPVPPQARPTAPAQPLAAKAPAPAAPAAPQQRQADVAAAIQQSIARIHDACQAPPLSPPEYRTLFEEIAREINENGLQGAQTLNSISTRAQSLGINLSRDDVRFIMEVVSEADPWFEQGASANLFAGRFRNFVVARCRSQGLNLSSDELDLIEAWFAGSAQPISAQAATRSLPAAAEQSNGGLWGEQPQRNLAADNADPGPEEFPKILRTRLRG